MTTFGTKEIGANDSAPVCPKHPDCEKCVAQEVGQSYERTLQLRLGLQNVP